MQKHGREERKMLNLRLASRLTGKAWGPGIQGLHKLSESAKMMFPKCKHFRAYLRLCPTDTLNL